MRSPAASACTCTAYCRVRDAWSRLSTPPKYIYARCTEHTHQLLPPDTNNNPLTTVVGTPLASYFSIVVLITRHRNVAFTARCGSPEEWGSIAWSPCLSKRHLLLLTGVRSTPYLVVVICVTIIGQAEHGIVPYWLRLSASASASGFVRCFG